jgi:AcrR family transcriptional regulator
VSDELERTPRQERSRRTLESMVGATRELLAERPFDEVTVEQITARAGLTKGAFYHRFRDKAGLLHYLNDRAHHEALEAWDAFLAPERWAEVPLESFLLRLVERAAALYASGRNLTRTLIYEARWRGEAVAARHARELNVRVRAQLTRVLATKRSELRVPAPAAATFILTVLAGTLTQALLFDDDMGLGRVPADALVAGLTRALMAYVGEGTG